MNATRAMDMARRMSESVLDYGAGNSRLLVRVMRAVAQGKPLDTQQVQRIVADLELSQCEADQFLRRITERDDDDRIVGIPGLSLNQHPHRFTVNGTTMSAWCAEHMASVEAIWNTFCEQIHFFASRRDAEQWAAGRDDIEIVDVATGFELGRRLTARVLAYAD